MAVQLESTPRLVVLLMLCSDSVTPHTEGSYSSPSTCMLCGTHLGTLCVREHGQHRLAACTFRAPATVLERDDSAGPLR